MSLQPDHRTLAQTQPLCVLCKTPCHVQGHGRHTQAGRGPDNQTRRTHTQADSHNSQIGGRGGKLQNLGQGLITATLFHEP